MEQKRTDEQETQIAVLEREEKTEEKQLSSKEIAAAKLNLFSVDVLKDFEYHTSNQKKIIEQSQAKQEIIEQTHSSEQSVKPRVSIEQVQAKYFEEQKKQQMQEKQLTISQQKQQEIVEESIEENQEIQSNECEEPIFEEQSLFGEIDKIESTGEEEIAEEISNYSKTDKKGYAFRLRLCTGVFCLLIALFGGWIIGNAIEIASTSAQIAETQVAKDTYDANLLSYLQKISQLDNWNDSNVNNDSSLIPIEEIIPITPTPLEDPTAYERESNWFDKICNWFSNLFGG